MKNIKRVLWTLWSWYTSRRLLIVILVHLSVVSVITFLYLFKEGSFVFSEHPSVMRIFKVFGLLLAINLLGSFLNRMTGLRPYNKTKDCLVA